MTFYLKFKRELFLRKIWYYLIPSVFMNILFEAEYFHSQFQAKWSFKNTNKILLRLLTKRKRMKSDIFPKSLVCSTHTSLSRNQMTYFFFSLDLFFTRFNRQQWTIFVSISPPLLPTYIRLKYNTKSNSHFDWHKPIVCW